MRNQVFLWILTWGVCLSTAFAYDWSTNPGDGSPGNPYQISEPNQLIAIGSDPILLEKCYVLTKDIDLAGTVFSNALIGWWEYGEAGFIGFFEGGGHVIRNLRIHFWPQEVWAVGLFGIIGRGGVVQNLTLENVDIRPLSIEMYIGGPVGGLAGQNLGTIINCHVSGYIEGTSWGTGGLVGFNFNEDYFGDTLGGSIIHCSSDCTVSGIEGVGGLAGVNNGSVYQCYSKGTVISVMPIRNGGLVGENLGVINKSFSTATVQGDTSFGGFIGFNNGIVRNCFFAGEVIGNHNEEGGLVANSNREITNCYSVGLITSSQGGLVGGNWGGIINSSFWDVEASGAAQSGGGTGLTTAQMQDPNTFLEAGWDFVGETDNGYDDDWRMPGPHETYRYPVLNFVPIDEGDGSPGNPYLIYRPEQIDWIASHPDVWDKHFKLIAHIDLTGRVFDSAVIAPDESGPRFEGVFNGCGHTIYRLTINTTDEYAGFFGVIGRRGSVKDLYFEDADIRGADVGGILAAVSFGKLISCHVKGIVAEVALGGGLVAISEGIVFRCSASCQVEADHAGGLLGIFLNGKVSQSRSEGSVEGWSQMGGLVGFNGDLGLIQDCYSTCSVTGDYETGGLVGVNTHAIIHCYSTGSVSSAYTTGGGLVGENIGVVCAGYWDLAGSRTSQSAGGEGIGGPSLEYFSTWEGNSWYDSDEYAWKIPMDYGYCLGYPILKWEFGLDYGYDYLEPIRPGGPMAAYVPDYRLDPQCNGSEQAPYVFDIQCRDFPADWDKYFVLTEDVDMTMAGYPIFDEPVIPYFNGRLDGQGHVIRGVWIETESYHGVAGFFGLLGPEAVVRDLGIEGNCMYLRWYTGLFAGKTTGRVERCYAKGNLLADSLSALFIGWNEGMVKNCYAAGAVTIDTMTEVLGGGFVGLNRGQVLNSYSTCTVETPDPNLFIHGFAGMNRSLVWNCFWDTEATGLETSWGGTGLNTAEMMDPASFAGWGDGSWKIAPGRDRPRLVWEDTEWTPDSGVDPEEWPDYVLIMDESRHYGGGSGTQTDPYILSDPNHLLTLGRHPADCDKYYQLEADLDFGWQTRNEALIGYFNGHFNGKGHRIRNLRIEDKWGCCLAVFGVLGEQAHIEKLGTNTIRIRGYYNLGVLVGENLGRIERCYVSGGGVEGEDQLGGLAGSNGWWSSRSEPVVSHCYADVSVDGFNLSMFLPSIAGGGLIGFNRGSVEACYSKGSIKHYIDWGVNVGGGLIGRNMLGHIEASFWDKNTSGRSTSSGGVGLSTSAMKTAATFINAGWDFVGEDTNGTNNFWRMCVNGVSYPKLSWENGRFGDYACPNGIGIDDLETLAIHWLTIEEGNPNFNYACDGSGDGRIDQQEMDILSKHWQE